MKGKSKTQRGITLVALIITIVVLMILAVVSISAIQNTEIISHATDAANRFNQAQKDENTLLGQYNSYFEGKIPGTGSGNGGAGEVEAIEVTEGQTVKLDSDGDGEEEDWIVLTATEGLVEIVSADERGSLTLGYKDSSVSVTTDLDGDGNVGNDGDKAIASYNNAITTINEYCKSLVKEELKSKVRSVGARTDTSGEYSSTDFNSCFKNSSTVKVKAGDEYYKTDHDKMVELGIENTEEYYWLASRLVLENSSTVRFFVRSVNAVGRLISSDLWSVNSDGNVNARYNPSYAVRLVITNPSGIRAQS